MRRPTMGYLWLAVCGVALAMQDGWLVAAAMAADQANEPVAARVERLIAQLGDPDFFARERAQTELIQIGFEAFDALTDAESHDDIEIAARVKYVLRKMQIQWSSESDPKVVSEILSNYQNLKAEDRLARMRRLAQLADDAGVPALCRLIRFEQDPVLSKQAALALIEMPSDERTNWEAREEVVNNSLAKSARPGAEWVRISLQARRDLAAAFDRWAVATTAEEQTYSQFPDQSRPELVIALLRKQVDWLDQLNRSDDSIAVLKRMIALIAGDQKNQQALAIELYKLADQRDRRGQHQLAQQVADQARGIFAGNSLEHFRLGFQLRQQGLLKWAEQELRQVIDIGPAGRELPLRAQWYLAEILHDQDKDQAAGEVLQAAVAAMKDNLRRGNAQQNLGRDVGEIQARMHYFLSKYAAEQQDRVKQIEELESAIKASPTDADVLIGMYQLSNPPPGWLVRTKKLIREAADHFRREIEQNPDDQDNSDAYNQFAWLIGNTEGDFDEAVRCSQKSLALRPDTAGYLDTLGRCLYAAGRLDEAVETQKKAVDLDPYSQQMRRQLKLFQEKRDEKTKNAQGPQ